MPLLYAAMRRNSVQRASSRCPDLLDHASLRQLVSVRPFADPAAWRFRHEVSSVPARQSPEGKDLQEVRKPPESRAFYCADTVRSDVRGRTAQASAERGPGAADRDCRDPARDFELANRRPARSRYDHQERRTLMRG